MLNNLSIALSNLYLVVLKISMIFFLVIRFYDNGNINKHAAIYLFNSLKLTPSTIKASPLSIQLTNNSVSNDSSSTSYIFLILYE